MDLGKRALWKFFSLAALVAALAGGWLLCREPGQEALSPALEPTVILDPGHGGEDGGAVAPDGTVESAINLDVAKRLEVILTFWGCDARLLRTEDVSLHDPEAATIRQKKVSDIHNRVKAINSQPHPRVISIHQNMFPQAKYRGAQVFYANGPLAQPWAKLTQQNLRLCLDPDNTRAEKPISHDVYLMNHITCPAILVECGFLSNPAELEQLKSPDHQTALAAVIAASYLQYARMEGDTPYASQSETSFLLHGLRQ